jgi:ubiquinone/menaquinone biosynthesis C-methylase UbiE
MPDPGWWEALWPDPVKVLSDVGVTPGMSVIDLCCGDGWFTLPLSKLVRKVLAIDIDSKLIDAAKVRFAERGGAPNCGFLVADAYDIAKVVREPVFLANAFHGVPDRPRLVRAVAETLRPGGLFAVVNWHPMIQTSPKAAATLLFQ